jgi:hypothetical protein
MERPLTESLRYIDAASLTSEEFNRFSRSIIKDATSSFNNVNELEKYIEQSLKIITTENILLYKRIKELEALLSSLSATINNGYGNRKTLYQNFYFSNDIIANSVSHEPLYSLISLPQTDLIASIYRDYDSSFLKKTVNIEYNISSLNGMVESGSTASDPSIINIIDNDLSSYWIKEIETNQDIEYIDIAITINSNTKILPSLLVNAISICPYPVYNMNLLSVYYRAPGDPIETIRLLNKTSPADTSGYFNLPEEFSNVKFIFPDIAASAITIIMRQPNYVTIGDKRGFTFGLRNFGAEYMNVSAETGSFIYKYNLPFGKTFSSVSIPESIDYTSKQVATNDSVKYELLLGEDLNTPFLFNSRIRSFVNTIGIKATLTKKSNQIPYITGIKFDFETK